MSSATTISTASSTPPTVPQHNSPQQDDPDVTLVATPLDIVEERDLAEQYCRDRLREIEEREQRLREREATMAGTPTKPSAAGSSSQPDDMTTVSASDAATIITATVVGTIDTASVAAASVPAASISQGDNSTDIPGNTRPTVPNNSNTVPQNPKPEPNHHRKTSSGGGVFARIFRRGESFKGDDASGAKIPAGRARSCSVSSVSSKPSGASSATVVSYFASPAMNGWTWCWKETPTRMSQHDPALVVGDPDECWIRYHFAVNRSLEMAFHAQKQQGNCALPDPLSGYEVDFDTMQQTKLASGHQRDVNRVFLVPCKDKPGTDKERKQLSRKTDEGDEVPPIPRSRDRNMPVWSWRETPSQMKRHDPSVIESVTEYLIRYTPESSAILEQAYQSGQKECRPLPGFSVNLTVLGRDEISAAGTNGSVHTAILLSFKQTKDATGYQRDVIRRSVKKNYN
jgi:hypothetical protein